LRQAVRLSPFIDTTKKLGTFTYISLAQAIK
jgi:hypothetical protein